MFVNGELESRNPHEEPGGLLILKTTALRIRNEGKGHQSPCRSVHQRQDDGMKSIQNIPHTVIRRGAYRTSIACWSGPCIGGPRAEDTVAELKFGGT